MFQFSLRNLLVAVAAVTVGIATLINPLKELSMKYRMRSLMSAVLVLPPLLAGAWLAYQHTAPFDEPWDLFDHLNTYRTGAP